MLAVAAAYLAISLGTSYNIGARHLMPVIPLLAMVGARHVVRSSLWATRILAIALVASPVIAFPHYIAHFSALVGGERNGARFLNDSNLDWGQDWNRLARKAVARGWQPMAYVYIGAGDPAAEMPAAVDAFNLRSLPSGGYVAVSSFAEAVGVPYLRAFGYREAAARLAALLEVTRAKGKAVGGIGGTITVYSLPDATGPAPSLETGPRARQHRSRGLGAFFRPSESAWGEPRRSEPESPSARPWPACCARTRSRASSPGRPEPHSRDREPDPGR